MTDYPEDVMKLAEAHVDKKLFKNSFDQIFIRDNIAAAIMADREARAEPVAWAAFAENGNIRVWSKSQDRETIAQFNPVPIYAAPPAPQVKVKELVEALEALPRRKEKLGGQTFSYVKLEDVIALAKHGGK